MPASGPGGRGRLGRFFVSLDPVVRVLPRRFAIALHRRAAADRVAVAVDVVDPPDRRPVLVLAQRVQREEGLLLRIRPRPHALEQQVMGVGAPLGVHVLGIRPKSDVSAGMSASPPIFSALPPGAGEISEEAYSLQLTFLGHWGFDQKTSMNREPAFSALVQGCNGPARLCEKGPNHVDRRKPVQTDITSIPREGNWTLAKAHL